MDIGSLRAKGGIVQAPPVPVEVTWTHEDPVTGEIVDDTFTVFALRLSVGWVDRIAARRVNDPETSRSAAMISEGLRFGENGKEKMSYEDACLLDPTLARVLMNAFNRVREAAEEEAKKSQPPMSSGTNLS